MPGEAHTVTELLAAYKAGRKGAFDRLIETLYLELRELAQVQLRKRHPNETLDTTALVNEAYCKLASGNIHHWKDRNHFYAACATTMRHLLVDNARHRLRDKRGSGQRALTLDENELASGGDPEWLIELDRLLKCLAEQDPRLLAVFECRYFGGFSVAETAEILEVSARTVERGWADSRSWLRQAMEPKAAGMSQNSHPEG